MPLEVKQIVEKERNSLLRLHILIINIHILLLDMEDKIIRATALRSTTCMKQKNGIYIKTEFQGPKEYSNSENITYPYIVVKIQQTDKSVIFSE